MAYSTNQTVPHRSSSRDLKLLGSCIISTHISYPYKDYSILSSSKEMKALSNKSIKVDNDPIDKLKKLFDEIHHLFNVASLLEYYHVTKQIGPQIVLEWINLFSTQYSEYITKDYFVGIEDIFSSSLNEKSEPLSLNGINYYSSTTRNFIIKILCTLVKTCLCKDDENDLNTIQTLVILSLCCLDYENALIYIKELLKIKDSEINMKFLLAIYQYVEYQSLKSLNELNGISKEYNIIYRLLKQEYSQLLNHDSLSLLFKLIILFKYYSFQDIEQYLKALMNVNIKNARIEALIITSNTKVSVSLLQNYIDQTDDIFTTYFITRFFNDDTTQPIQLYKIVEESFIESLNKLKLFTERLLTNQIIDSLIDKIESGRHNHINSQSEKEYYCYFCDGKIVIDKNTHRNDKDEYVDICSKCIGRFHSCSICRIPIDIEASTKIKYRSMVDIQNGDERINGNEFKFLWCSSCLHGGHLEEIKKWFSELNVCPQADCHCLCLNSHHILL